MFQFCVTQPYCGAIARDLVVYAGLFPGERQSVTGHIADTELQRELGAVKASGERLLIKE